MSWFDTNAPQSGIPSNPAGGSVSARPGAGSDGGGAPDQMNWRQNPDGSWTGSGGLAGRTVQIPAGYSPYASAGEPGFYGGGFEQQGGNRAQIPSGEPGSPGNTGQGDPSTYGNGGAYRGGGPNAGGLFTGGAPAGAGGAAPTLNRNDPASVQAFITYYAQQPGANPSLARDPGYWAGKISSGELGSDQNYIIGKFMTPEGAPAGSYNNGLNGPVGATPFNFQYDANSPDAQFIRGEAMRAATQGFAARGTLNTGGAVKALQDRAAGLASVDLGNQFQRQLTTHQTNFNEPLQANNQAFGQNFNLANLGLNATTAGINGANAVASNATSYANTAQNNTNQQSGLTTGIGTSQGNAILGGQNAYNNFYGDLGRLTRGYPQY